MTSNWIDMKHISTTIMDNANMATNSILEEDSLFKSTIITTFSSITNSKNNQYFHDKVLEIFEKMVETNIRLRREFLRE